MKRTRSSYLILLGLVLTSFILVFAIFVPLIAHDPQVVEISNRFARPSFFHPFGTDHFGRDIWSRTAFGARHSLWIAAISVLLATLLGVPLGMLAAYWGRWIDKLLMRLVDVILAFPIIMFALFVRLIMGSRLISLIIAISFAYAPVFARTARSSVLQVKERLYIEAAIAVGLRPTLILYRYVLPNIAAPLVLLATVFFADAIIIESSLSFLGIGVSPLIPSLGAMLADGRRFIQNFPHVALFPGMIIGITVLGVNLLGDGLRDMLDPMLIEK